ncbi:4-alpha-glucanotransferase [Chitinophaga nivalis]|uniref:4-alpha-glucanotransferase n=1 Tax=Chitinophaga nivalis TaxID=2991709 RepID=A0ABT3IRA7_9BACT|nr:4-alpha-glucanotransferase [Chitinophaga nivalis]MCW3463825.1 4-alpha-glucanotransferase [Chitinophaga nivalis]MCW3486485.1 4-alpha-glucanotransferase [Chitinophaga nivalis]
MYHRLRFYLRYHTYYGQDLFLLGNIPALGNEVPQQARAMQWLDDTWWYTEILIAPDETLTLQYQYLLQEPGNVVYEGAYRTVVLSPTQHRETIFTDAWHVAAQPENAWQTTPFTRIFFQRPVATIAGILTATHIFRVQAPLLPRHQTICLLGNTPQTGNWNIQHPLLLQYDAQGWFCIALRLEGMRIPLQYKYGVYDLDTQQFTTYEAGENREVQTMAVPGRQVILHDGMVRLAPPRWQGAGVAVPVFSLRSSEGFGTGEFSDLPELAAWAQQSGLQLIQLLPVNDTTQTLTWKDSYPYSAISSFALHPLYIRLQEVGVLPEQHPLQKQFYRLRQWLNEKDTVDYESVMAYKTAYLQALYDEKGEQLQTRDFWHWFAANEHWLLPYAIFCYLRETCQTADFTQWPVYNVYDYTAINRLVMTDEKAAGAAHYHFFVQYHLHRQLAAAVAAVHRQGVALKGDIPIGISRNSVDVWMNPELYHLDMQAGAPPDDFTTLGQNWGFPTYNWSQMAVDGYSWWVQRLRHLSAYFDAFRIDHILGFFRIWQIPASAVQGILGYFHPAIPVTPEELTASGIPFEEDRYCAPYITDEMLDTAFGHYAGMMKDTFLETLPSGRYRLLPGFDTQQQVKAQQLPEAIASVLYDWLAEVLFLKATVDGKTGYHPRYNLMATASFAALDPLVQDRLRALYHDYFYVRQEDYWRREAMHKLPLIKSATDMLICGEDLGMVPACVPGIMQEQGMLSLEVQRMPKCPDALFTELSQIPYLSVLTPDTHDMSTLRGWWQEDAAITQQYYTRVLQHTGTAPAMADASLIKEILTRHLQAPAMWCIFQIQDLLAATGVVTHLSPEEERINIPAVAAHYWRYRIPAPLTTYGLQVVRGEQAGIQEQPAAAE